MTTRNMLTGGGDGPTPPEGPVSFSSAVAGSPASLSGGAGGDGKGRRIGAAINPEVDLACCRLPLTDLGNAERWRLRFGDDFRFCAELGWLHWEGRRWKLLSEEKDRAPAEVMQSVFQTVRAIRNEAALVAASGFPTEYLTDKQEKELRAWADAFNTTSRELYLTGDTDGLREKWLEEREPMDIVVGKGQLWSQKIAAWAKTSEGVGKLQAIGSLAKCFPDIAIKVDQLDADHMAINVLNGTLRLVRNSVKRPAEDIAAGKSEWHVVGWKVKREPHNRADLITKLAPIKYVPNAQCLEYDAFIARVQPDETMRRFIHQWGGLSLTGDISEQKLAFFYGSGRNGKGTWVEAVAHIAGDYAGSIPIESFLDSSGKRRGDQATPDIARLPGVRFLRVSEPQKGSSLNEGLIKMVTGGDPVDARHLNKGFFTFLPAFKMTISGNHKPKIKDTSDGIWRRMQLVPWAVSIPAEEVDRKLGDKLRAEASGILNRLINGLLDWRQNGLIEPDQVRNATRAYRDDSDDLGRFLAACCEVGDDPLKCRAKASELYDFYKAWAEAAGGSPWQLKGFNAAMRDKGFEQKQSNGMWWQKVRLIPLLTIDDVKRGEWLGVAAIDSAVPQNSDDPDWQPPDW